MNARPSLLGLVVFALTAAACRSCGQAMEHLTGFRHPWHAYPTLAAGAIGCLPLAPLALGEAVAFHDGDPSLRRGVFGPAAGVCGMCLALPVGGACWLVGLPLEWVVPERERPARKRKPAKAPQDQAPPPVEPASRDGT